MILEKQLSDALIQAFKAVFDLEVDTSRIVLQPTRKEFEGTHTFVCFPFVKQTRKSPEATGTALGEWMVANVSDIIAFNVVKGFLNLSLADPVWTSLLRQINETEQYGKTAPTGTEVMIEYASPNTNKPLHLGHLRNIFLGWSVARILKANGNTVHRVQIINDRGIHICKSMIAWQKFGEGITPDKAGVKGDKLVGDYYVKFDQSYKAEIKDLVADGMLQEEAEKKAPILVEAQELLRKWENKDPEAYELWQRMNGWVYDGFGESYTRMGVDFDKLYYESDTYLLGREEVLKGLEQGIFYKKEDGSVWVDLSEEGLDQKLLLRADGTSVYMTQDIGTAILRYRDYPNIIKQIYTVGNEQEYHFKVLFLILAKLGYGWAKECYHLSYGMVDLPTGRMKSREGTVVDADDIMEEMATTAREHTEELGKIEGFSEEQASALYEMLGLGALKYFLLKVDPRKRMLFDPNESIQFQGNTAPFIQYTHARISALLRKAKEENMDMSADLSQVDIHDIERQLVFILGQFPDKIREAGENYAPDIIANYAFELAKEYNRFYQEVSVFGEEDDSKKVFRILLSKVIASTIASAMDLLGIDVPERM